MFYKSAIFSAFLLVLAFSQATFSDELKVKISPQLDSLTVLHNGKPVKIQRIQDPKNTIVDDYALTSRTCPPFCVQPMQLAPGVTTIGELELLDFLQRKSNGDQSILIIDSRTPDWV